MTNKRTKALMYSMSAAMAAGALLTCPRPAAAQEGDDYYQSKSWLPFTTNGYVGAGVGRARYKGDCTPLLTCDDRDTTWKAYVGGRVYNIVGVELSYLDLGNVDRNGGSASAKVADASLILNAPLGRFFGVFARGGGGYAWTRTSSAIPGFDTGRRSDFDWGYGAGVNVNFTRNWTLRGEWQRQQVRFTNEREDIDLWTAGLNYRF